MEVTEFLDFVYIYRRMATSGSQHLMDWHQVKMMDVTRIVYAPYAVRVFIQKGRLSRLRHTLRRFINLGMMGSQPCNTFHLLCYAGVSFCLVAKKRVFGFDYKGNATLMLAVSG